MQNFPKYIYTKPPTYDKSPLVMIFIKSVVRIFMTIFIGSLRFRRKSYWLAIWKFRYLTVEFSVLSWRWTLARNFIISTKLNHLSSQRRNFENSVPIMRLIKSSRHYHITVILFREDNMKASHRPVAIPVLRYFNTNIDRCNFRLIIFCTLSNNWQHYWNFCTTALLTITQFECFQKYEQ